MSPRNRVIGMFFACVVVAALAGCAAGPVAIRAGRIKYNEAIQDTANQQLLLNIVRLKYRESVSFLDVSTISAAYKFDASGSFQFLQPNHPAPPAVPGPTDYSTRTGAISGTYDEDPIITYIPLQGTDFAKRYFEQIDLRTIGTLLRSGWHVDTVMRVVVDSIEVQVPATPNGPPAHVLNLINNPTDPVSYAKFKDVCDLLRKLQRLHALTISAPEEAKEKLIAANIPWKDVTLDRALSADKMGYHFVPSSTGSAGRTGSNALLDLKEKTAPPEAVILTVSCTGSTCDAAPCAAVSYCQSLDTLLGFQTAGSSNCLACSSPATRIVLKSGSPKPAEPGEVCLHVHSRSLKEIMFYLAQGVKVPPWDENKVKTYHLDINGSWPAVDWRSCTKDLLDVQSLPWSPLPPPNAFVAVQYRGSWFYISDEVSEGAARAKGAPAIAQDPDLGQIGKDNFALLALIYALKAGEVKISSPELAIAQ